MGYSAQILSDVLKLDIGPRVIDVGSQDAHIASASDLSAINAAIHARRGEPLELTPPAKVEAREVFRRAGFDYWRCDVDRRPHTVYVDITTMAFPRELRASFDYVGNVGTTEHLSNPGAGFALIHYLCKPGGIMFHDVPLYGLGIHGLVNPTPKFWHAMIRTNDYRVLGFDVVPVLDHNYVGGHFNREWTYMRGIENFQHSAMARVTLRKGADRAFVTPVDVMLDEPGLDLLGVLRGSLAPFIAAGTYTEEEAHLAAREAAARMLVTPSILDRARARLRFGRLGRG